MSDLTKGKILAASVTIIWIGIIIGAVVLGARAI